MATAETLGKEIAGKTLTPTDRLDQLIGRVDIKKRFEDILGKKAPSFISSMLSLRNSNPALKASDPMSIISAAAIAATLDLPINPNLGFAHIVPYSGVAQFQMGWKGFVQLAIRTGLYQTMNAAEIYEGELVKYNRVTGETVIDESQRKSDKVVAYVAYFKLTTGFEKYLLMSVEQVTKHAKKYSKSFSKPGTPWQINFDAMALKTVMKLLLSKYGILSIELQKALQYDQSVVTETVEGEKVTYPDGGDVIDATPVTDAPGDAQEPAQ
jgi:recombination protein RecT